MRGSLKLSWLIVLVLMLRPVICGMKMVHAAEESKFENRKVKESAPACDDTECRIECQDAGSLTGRCFGQGCVCFGFEKKKGGAEEAEKREMNKYQPDCTADPPCIAACKKDGFCSGQCLGYICYCLPNCTAHHNHYPPQLN